MVFTHDSEKNKTEFYPIFQISSDTFYERKNNICKSNYSELRSQFSKQKDGRAIVFVPTRNFAGELSEELNKDENLQILDVKSNFVTGLIPVNYYFQKKVKCLELQIFLLLMCWKHLRLVSILQYIYLAIFINMKLDL